MTTRLIDGRSKEPGLISARWQKPSLTSDCRQAEGNPQRVSQPSLRVGLFGIGLDAYWPQFKGLRSRLEGYRGKIGRGLSVEISVRHGPVTLLSMVQTADGKLKFLVAGGESAPGPVLEIGYTNSRYRFSIGASRFVENWNRHGPAHHCVVGVGHIAGTLQKLAALLGAEAVQVC